MKIPYQKNGKRDYKAQYENYDGKESVKKDRAKRNAARAMLKKDGVDVAGKDVDHKKALSKGGGNGKANLRAVSKSTNRSFKRNADGSMK